MVFLFGQRSSTCWRISMTWLLDSVYCMRYYEKFLLIFITLLVDLYACLTRFFSLCIFTLLCVVLLFSAAWVANKLRHYLGLWLSTWATFCQMWDYRTDKKYSSIWEKSDSKMRVIRPEIVLKSTCDGSYLYHMLPILYLLVKQNAFNVVD